MFHCTFVQHFMVHLFNNFSVLSQWTPRLNIHLCCISDCHLLHSQCIVGVHVIFKGITGFTEKMAFVLMY